MSPFDYLFVYNLDGEKTNLKGGGFLKKRPPKAPKNAKRGLCRGKVNKARAHIKV